MKTLRDAAGAEWLVLDGFGMQPLVALKESVCGVYTKIAYVDDSNGQGQKQTVTMVIVGGEAIGVKDPSTVVLAALGL